MVSCSCLILRKIRASCTSLTERRGRFVESIHTHMWMLMETSSQLASCEMYLFWLVVNCGTYPLKPEIYCNLLLWSFLVLWECTGQMFADAWRWRHIFCPCYYSHHICNLTCLCFIVHLCLCWYAKWNIRIPVFKVVCTDIAYPAWTLLRIKRASCELHFLQSVCLAELQPSSCKSEVI